MTRTTPGMLAGITIAMLVAIAACGLFAFQNVEAYAQCSSLPGPAPCSGVSPLGEAASAIFVAVGALMVAIVMAITAGINARGDAPPNSALARQIEAEDAAYKRARERYEELKELNMLALAHARGDSSTGVPSEADLAEAEATVSEFMGGSGLPGDAEPQWQEQQRQETADERRKRLLADRLRRLAQNKPDTLAEVLKTWINQPRLPMR